MKNSLFNNTKFGITAHKHVIMESCLKQNYQINTYKIWS